MSQSPAQRAAEAVIAQQTTRLDRLDAVKRSLKGDIEQLFHEAEHGPRRASADKRVEAETLARVLERLP